MNKYARVLVLSFIFPACGSDDAPVGLDEGVVDAGADASMDDNSGRDQDVLDLKNACIVPKCDDLTWQFDGAIITLQSSTALESVKLRGEISTDPLPASRVAPFNIDGEFADGLWRFEFKTSHQEFNEIDFFGFEISSCDGLWSQPRIGSGDIDEAKLVVSCGQVQ